VSAIVSLIDPIKSFIEALSTNYGAGGFFVAAFLSNLIPFFPAIYLGFLAVASAFSKSAWDVILLTVSAGVGAGLGKFVVFGASEILGKKFIKGEKRERVEQALRASKIGVFVLVVLFAALPLPDDVLYIPLGAAGFKATTFLVGVIIGKIILTGIVTGLSSTASWIVKYFVSSGRSENPALLAGLTALLILFTGLLLMLVYYVDWMRVTEALTQKGWGEGLRTFLDEVKNMFKRSSPG